MRRITLGLATLAAVALAQNASAADLPAKAPMYSKAPAMIAAYNWTGWYIGATLGGAWSKADVSESAVNGAAPAFSPQDIPALNALGSPSISGSNVIFGGKFGYNWQSTAWVFGLEADLSSSRFNRTATTTGNPFTNPPGGPPFAGGFATFNTNVSTTWLATVRPRIGYAIDRALFYATGGVAFGNVSFANTYIDFAPLELNNGFEASAASKTKTGWTLGAGLDYGLTPNWILSVEYLHVDLGSISASGLVTSSNATTATLNFSTRLRTDLVRGGIAYKF